MNNTQYVGLGLTGVFAVKYVADVKASRSPGDPDWHLGQTSGFVALGLLAVTFLALGDK